MKNGIRINIIIILGIVFLTGTVLFNLSKSNQVPVKIIPIWEKKIETRQILKIGIITDTQIHPSLVDITNRSPHSERYLKSKYKKAIESFLLRMDEFNPELIVFPGDIIEGTNDADYIGMAGLRLVKSLFDSTPFPVYWALGNHDLRSVTREQFKEALQIDYINKWFDYGDYRIIIIDTNYYPDDTKVSPGKYYTHGHVSQDGLRFLENALQTDKHTLVFMHHPPVILHDMKPFGRNSGLLNNASEIQKLLLKYNVTASFGGHLETKAYFKKQDVQYFSLPGAIKSVEYPGSFYEVIVSQDGAQVKMHHVDSETGNYKELNFLSEN